MSLGVRLGFRKEQELNWAAGDGSVVSPLWAGIIPE